MDRFNFFFSFYGLLLGFSVAAVAKGLVGTLILRRERGPSLLLALLAAFLLQDMATIWVFAWNTREHLAVNYLSIYGAMTVGLSYYVAAVSAFPTFLDPEADAENHYWKNKRIVFGAVIAGSLLSQIHAIYVGAVVPGDAFFWAIHAIYWIPLLILFFTKRGRVDTALLGVLVVGYLIEPSSELFGVRWAS